MQHDSEKYLIAIDFETANSHPLSACQVGMIVFSGGEVVFEFESLIKPPKRYNAFNYYNTKIHNIRADDVVDSLNWLEMYPQFEKYFNNGIFIAHNAAFDMRVLKELNSFYGISMPPTEYFCTVELSRRIYPYLPNHKLNTVSAHLEIQLNHHDAMSDAFACALIVFKSLQMIEEEDVIEMFKIINMNPKVLER